MKQSILLFLGFISFFGFSTYSYAGKNPDFFSSSSSSVSSGNHRHYGFKRRSSIHRHNKTTNGLDKNATVVGNDLAFFDIGKGVKKNKKKEEMTRDAPRTVCSTRELWLCVRNRDAKTGSSSILFTNLYIQCRRPAPSPADSCVQIY